MPAKKKSTSKRKSATKKPAKKKVVKKATINKKSLKKSSSKKKPVKKTVTKKKATKNAAAKKPVAKKKATVKKSTTKKSAMTKKKSVTKKAATTTKKTVTQKKVATKKPAKKVAAKKTTAKKTAVVKPLAEHAVAKPPAKKAVAKRSAKTKLAIAEFSSLDKPSIKPLGEIGHDDYMGPEMTAHFQRILLAYKAQLREKVDGTMHYMQDDSANLPDLNDRASLEEEFSLELRTRDRERKLIKKIDESLQLIDDGEYGYCEACGVEIGVRRLEARPTAVLCIDCKTIEEMKERQAG